MTKNCIYTGVVLLLVAICSQVVGLDQMAFPGATWEQASPESQNVDSAKLEAAVDYRDIRSSGCGRGIMRGRTGNPKSY